MKRFVLALVAIALLAGFSGSAEAACGGRRPVRKGVKGVARFVWNHVPHPFRK